MRVLHIDTEVGARGGERQLGLLLAHREHEAEVVAPVAATWPQVLRDVKVHRVAFAGRWLGRWALRRIVDRFRPDLVAAHTHHALALADGLAPMAVHRRVDFVPSPTTVGRYQRVAGVIAVSGAVARVLRMAGVRAPITVVRDAVVPLRPGPPPTGRPHLVAVGALVDHKGHEDLLEAMVALPAVRLTIAGNGPRRGRLESLVRRRGLVQRVRLPGHIADVGGLLRRSHLFVHPSREEGLGQAVVEALTAGCPVVATRAGGLPETVRDLGLLVPPHSPEALTAGIRAALADLGAARNAVLAARDEVVARHEVAKLVRRTESAYARALR